MQDTKPGKDNGPTADKSAVDEGSAVDDADISSFSEQRDNDADREPQSAAGAKTQEGGRRSRNTRIREVIVTASDKLARFVLKAVLFGLVAAAAGVLAVILLQNYSVLNSTGGIPDELAIRDQKIAELEDSISSLADRVVPLAKQEQVAALAADIEQLRTSVDGNLEGAEAKLDSAAEELNIRIDELAERQSAVETSLESIPPPETPTDALESPGIDLELARRLDTISERLTELESSMGEPLEVSVADSEIRSIESRLSRVETGITQAASAEILEQWIAGSEKRLASLEARLTGDVPPTQAIALIGVRAAAETGAPYLRLLRDAGLSDTEIPGPIMVHAEAGVATLDELQRSFGALARAALKSEAEQVKEGGGIAGILGSLVQVRPLTPQEGDSPAATLSRAEGSLMAGDLEGALGTLDELSEHGREIFADWIEAGKARLDVLSAIDTMLESPVTEQ